MRVRFQYLENLPRCLRLDIDMKASGLSTKNMVTQVSNNFTLALNTVLVLFAKLKSCPPDFDLSLENGIVYFCFLETRNLKS